MPSTYPAALDDLTPGNTGLNHGDVTDALAAVQAALGVNPQGAEATVAARLDAGPTFGVNVDLPDQGPISPDPPAPGFTRLTATTMEGEDTPPFLTVVNSEGFDAHLLSDDEGDNRYLPQTVLTAQAPGTLIVRGADPNYPAVLPPGTDGQILAADSSAEVGLTYTDRYGINVDLLDQGFTTPDPPAPGFTRLTATTNEPDPPFLALINSEGTVSRLVSIDEAGDLFLAANFLSVSPLGTLLVKGADNDFPELLEPGTDGQVLTADSSSPLGVVWADPA